jgi:hypothetical protein
MATVSIPSTPAVTIRLVFLHTSLGTFPRRLLLVTRTTHPLLLRAVHNVMCTYRATLTIAFYTISSSYHGNPYGSQALTIVRLESEMRVWRQA